MFTLVIARAASTFKRVNIEASVDAADPHKLVVPLFEALLQSLGAGFAAADADGNGTLDAQELFEAIKKRIPDLLEESKLSRHDQHPDCFPKFPDKYPLFQK